MGVACNECERLTRVEIESTRRAADAQSRLQAFYPEPPFGEAAANELHGYQDEVEKARASLDKAMRERAAHGETHLMTLSR